MDDDLIGCTNNQIVRISCGVAASFSTFAVSFSTIKNLCFNEARSRYPGRLVAILGIVILLLELSTSLGWIVGGYKQLDYRDGPDEKLWRNVCTIQGSVIEAAVVCSQLSSTKKVMTNAFAVCNIKLYLSTRL
jgi:hypothetical protein